MYKDGLLLVVGGLMTVYGGAGGIVPRDGPLPLVFEEAVLNFGNYNTGTKRAVPLSLRIDDVEIECETDGHNNAGTVACRADIGGETVTTCIGVFGDEQCLETRDSLGLGDYVYVYDEQYSDDFLYPAGLVMSLREFPERDPSFVELGGFPSWADFSSAYLSSSVQVSLSTTLADLSEAQPAIECAGFDEQAEFNLSTTNSDEGDPYGYGTNVWRRNISCPLGELPGCDSSCRVVWGSDAPNTVAWDINYDLRVWRDASALCVASSVGASTVLPARNVLPDYLWGDGAPCATKTLDDSLSLSDAAEIWDLLTNVAGVATVTAAVLIGVLVYCKVLPPGTQYIVILCCDAVESVGVVSLWIAVGRCRDDLLCPDSLVVPTRVVAVADGFSVLLELAVATISISSGQGKSPTQSVHFGLSKIFCKDVDDQTGFFSLAKRTFLAGGALPTIAYIAAYVINGEFGFFEKNSWVLLVILLVVILAPVVIFSFCGPSCYNRIHYEASSTTATSFVAAEVLGTAGLLTVIADFGSIVRWPLALRILGTFFELW